MRPPRTFYKPGGLDVLFYGDVVEGRTHDIEFYTALARRIGGPVIDMGCGTGRVSMAIAQQGIDVIGVDSSEAMLELARAELANFPAETRAHVRLIAGDISELVISVKSPLVICPFRTMQNLLSDEEWTAALTLVRDTLTQEGLFAFDVWTPPPLPDFKLRKPSNVTALVGGRRWFGRVQLTRRSCVPESDVVHEEWEFSLLSREGGPVVLTQQRQFSYRRIDGKRIGELLESCGLAGSSEQFPRSSEGAEYEHVWLTRKR